MGGVFAPGGIRTQPRSGKRRALRRPPSAAGRMSSRYRLAGTAPLHWRRWADEYLLYDPDSGDTHLLDETAWNVLAALERQPADLDTLASDVARALGLGLTRQVLEQVATLVRELESSGLLTRAPE